MGKTKNWTKSRYIDSRFFVEVWEHDYKPHFVGVVRDELTDLYEVRFWKEETRIPIKQIDPSVSLSKSKAESEDITDKGLTNKENALEVARDTIKSIPEGIGGLTGFQSDDYKIISIISKTDQEDSIEIVGYYDSIEEAKRKMKGFEGKERERFKVVESKEPPYLKTSFRNEKGVLV